MLFDLPEGYEPFILKLDQDEATLTMKEVKTRALAEEKRKFRRNDEQSTDPHSKETMAKNKSAPKLARTRQDERKDCDAGIGEWLFHPVTRRPVRCFAHVSQFRHIAKHCEGDSDDQASD